MPTKWNLIPSSSPCRASDSPISLPTKCEMMASPGTNFGQYQHFFIRATAKIPFFCNSTMALRMQNPLSGMNTLPLPQTGSVKLSNVPTVFPRSSNCLLLSCGDRSFPSRNSRDQMMLESAHPASWYSFPNGQDLWGTNINPGQVYLFSHLLIDSSMQLIQLGTKFAAMFFFHLSSISRTSQNLSLYVGGLSLVYFIC